MQAQPLSFTAARHTSNPTDPLYQASAADVTPARTTVPPHEAATPPPDLATPPSHMHLLIVDDDPPVRDACAEIAATLGFAVQVADTIAAAREAITANSIDLVLLDLKLPNSNGLTLLEEVRAQRPDAIVIVMTAYATVGSAVEAMRIGAGDYITKPFSIEELSNVLGRAAQRRVFDNESRSLRERLRSGQGPGNLLGNSPPMEKLYRILSKVAVTAHPVLILGEAGTGKELVARSIHANGPLAALPFVPVDCGSLLPELIEGELFGYTKGARNATSASRPGLLAAPEGSTVFLDELGELTPDLQARLLRALQERQVRPVGGGPPLPLRARVLAATNRDIEAMVNNGSFRKDLYYRLNVVSLRIPPLRERKSDIPLLAAHLLDRARRDSGLAYTFSDDSLHMLMAYDWPGNVRELEHAIDRACALSSGPVLHRADFPGPIQSFRREVIPPLTFPGAPTADPARTDTAAGPVLSIAELEKQAILATIRQLRGDKLLAARLLGIGKTTLYRKLKEYGISEGQDLR